MKEEGDGRELRNENFDEEEESVKVFQQFLKFFFFALIIINGYFNFRSNVTSKKQKNHKQKEIFEANYAYMNRMDEKVNKTIIEDCMIYARSYILLSNIV